MLRTFLRWLFSWRTARRVAVALACFATLIALVYTEEDWRGQRAWERCKAELEAKGAVLDWSAFIPPPVPDEQNFFKAPGINESDWVGRGSTGLSKRFAAALSKIWEHTNALLLAEVAIVPLSSEALLRIDDSNAPVQASNLIAKVVGPTLSSALGFTLVPRPLEGIRPAQITLTANRTIAISDLVNLFPRSIDPRGYDPLRTSLCIRSAGGNAFHITLLPPPENAVDYLARTDTLGADFDAIRAALRRPYARMYGDYTQPYAGPIPNFLMMRTLAQILADRVNCHYLLDDSAAALTDLTLLHDVCRILEAKPTGKPMTLVAAMMDVAITGVYAYTIVEGFQLGAWHEPQLVALQQQLSQTDLLPITVECFLAQRAASANSLETIPPAEMFKQMSKMNNQEGGLLDMLKNPFYAFLLFAPRGWVYQNMVFGAKLHPLFEIGDTARHLVLPEIARRDAQEIEARSKWSPYSFLRTIANPNFTKAWRTTAHNQTLVDQAQIACALERYRLAHGEYPESLAALVPQFIEKIPHDIIGGRPLHYRRSPDGTFLLYSIGWDEKDDGGVVVRDSNGNEDLGSGDWVWQGGKKRSAQSGGTPKAESTDDSDHTDKKLVSTALPNHR